MITLTPEQQQYVEHRFQSLATEWNAISRYRSNTNSLRNHPVYLELVSLGEAVLPIILAQLEREPAVSCDELGATPQSWLPEIPSRVRRAASDPTTVPTVTRRPPMHALPP